MKLVEIFASEQDISEERLKVKDLRFGTHIQKGDHLPNKDDSSTKVFNQEYIDRWIQSTGLTGEEEVILDPNAEAWFDKIRIPALEKGKGEFTRQKAQSLKHLGTTNEDVEEEGETRIIRIQDNYGVRDFASDVAKVLEEDYGTHNYELFLETLQAKLK